MVIVAVSSEGYTALVEVRDTRSSCVLSPQRSQMMLAISRSFPEWSDLPRQAGDEASEFPLLFPADTLTCVHASPP